MAMARPKQIAEIKRRIPRQARATETVSAIREAAAQVLEAGGLASFTTNAVAERAGVSIGTLYQYFADKDAILRSIAEHELKATFANVARAMSSEQDVAEEVRVRAIVHAIVNAFRGRQRARKAVVQAMFSDGGGAVFQAPVAAFISANALETLSEQQTFVLSRAVLGAIRSAVLEEQRFLKSRSFEDELVRLIVSYLAAVNDLPVSTAPG
jgi:AcrR family transcriptional regulator